MNKTAQCIACLLFFVSCVGDHQPDNGFIDLPSCFSKSDICKKMQEENTAVNQPTVSLPYGVKSLPKFKLLNATLLLSINARFFNTIFDFYNSTLCIDNSTSLFQNAIFNFYNSTFCTDNSTSIFQILFRCDIRLCVLPLYYG